MRDIRNRKRKCSPTFPSLDEHVSVVIHIKQVFLVIKPIYSILNGYEHIGEKTFAFILLFSLPKSIIMHIRRLISDSSCSEVQMTYTTSNASTVVKNRHGSVSSVFLWTSCYSILLIFLYEIDLTHYWIGCSEHLWCE